ncbi:ANTH domain-containing protein [Chytriomyces sp. MP71]|nr:ANTH domain-containing protein [Chytriomyces sp. MP71]
MSTVMAMEYAIKKSTTPLLKPIKQKHTQTLGEMTYGQNIHVLFRALSAKMYEPNWIVVFKTLLLIHILMREANVEGIMHELMDNPDLMSTDRFRDRTLSAASVAQTKNIKHYSKYLQGKVKGFEELKFDFVRSKAEVISKFRTGTVDMAFMKLLDKLQLQITALLDCSFYTEELDNYVTLQCFRVLIGDMLSLFHILNEGVIKMLGEYFELPKAEALRGLAIYKTFATQTSRTVTFFETARRLGDSLGIDVPTFKHAPISLAGALEEYVNAPDFEYQQEAFQNKKSGKSAPARKASENALQSQAPQQSSSHQPQQQQRTQGPPSPVKPAAVLIDFFASTDETSYSFNAPSLNTWAQPGVGIPFDSLSINGSNPGYNAAGIGGFPGPAAGANPFAQQGAGFNSFGGQPGGFGGAPQPSNTDPSFTVDNVFGNVPEMGNGFASASTGAFGSSANPSFASVASGAFGAPSPGPAFGSSMSAPLPPTASNNPFASTPVSPPSTSKTGSNNPFASSAVASPSVPAASNNPFAQPPLPSPSVSQFNPARANSLPFGAQSYSQQPQGGGGFPNQSGPSFAPQPSPYGMPQASAGPFGGSGVAPFGTNGPASGPGPLFGNAGAFSSAPQSGFGQPAPQPGIQGGGFNSMQQSGPTLQVVDPLAGVNPFAKASVPLAAMGHPGGGMGAMPLYGGNMGMSFHSMGAGGAVAPPQGNPLAGLPSVQKNNSNNPFYK